MCVCVCVYILYVLYYAHDLPSGLLLVYLNRLKGRRLACRKHRLWPTVHRVLMKQFRMN